LEKTSERAEELRQKFTRPLQKLWEKPGPRLGLECAGRAAIGLLLARGSYFGYAAPFGLAYAAAAASGWRGFAAMAGVMLGYFSTGQVTGTLLLAATLLILALKLILLHKEPENRQWVMALTATFAFCAALLPYIITRGWPAEMAFYFYSAALLAGGCTCLYGQVGQLRSGFAAETGFRSEVGLLALMAGVLLSLADVRLMAGISLGRLAAEILVLLSAREVGPGWGAAAGLIAGMTMDIAPDIGPLFSVIYGFGGFLSGVFFKKGKLAGTLAYISGASVCALWAWGTPYRFAVYYETFAATVLFMLLPDIEIPRALLLTEGGESSMGVLSRCRWRLENAAKAFRDMVDWLGQSVGAERAPEGVNLFARVAEKVCRRCKSAPRCWGSDSETTRDALNGALPAMLEKGTVEAEQFPSYFRSSCKNLEKFLEESRRQLYMVMQTRRQRTGQRESEKLMCRQYSDLARVLADCAEEMPRQLKFDLKLERRINRHFAEKGIKCHTTAYTGEFGRLRIELETQAEMERQELCQALESLAGKRLLFEERGSGDKRYCFKEAELYRIIAGAAAGKKPGQQVSGDSATYFKTEEGLLYVLLADGMGSGEGAAKESGMALNVLERFLRAGVSAEVALRTLDSAFMIKNRDSGVFSTVDLLRVNLFTGQAVIFKYGAAPSYFKRSGSVKRLSSGSLPIGTGELRVSPAQSRFTMSPGDVVVMMSDGIREEEGDGWLTKLIQSHESTGPRELAAAITATGIAGKTPSDDMTVCVFKLEEQA